MNITVAYYCLCVITDMYTWRICGDHLNCICDPLNHDDQKCLSPFFTEEICLSIVNDHLRENKDPHHQLNRFAIPIGGESVVEAGDRGGVEEQELFEDTQVFTAKPEVVAGGGSDLDEEVFDEEWHFEDFGFDSRSPPADSPPETPEDSGSGYGQNIYIPPDLQRAHQHKDWKHLTNPLVWEEFDWGEDPVIEEEERPRDLQVEEEDLTPHAGTEPVRECQGEAGCIGCGKSTTLDCLAAMRPLWDVRSEPIKEWQSVRLPSGESVDLLEAFYNVPSAESFRQLQFSVLHSLANRYLQPVLPEERGRVIVFERSLKVAREVFLRSNCHLLSPVDLKILEDTCFMFEGLLEVSIPAIYITCTEREMIRRIQQRARPAERNLSIEHAVDIKRRMDCYAVLHNLDFIDTTHLSAERVAEKILEWHRLFY